MLSRFLLLAQIFPPYKSPQSISLHLALPILAGLTPASSANFSRELCGLRFSSIELNRSSRLAFVS